jgi:hypothetical protein
MQLFPARSEGAESLAIVNRPVTLGRLLDVDPGSAIMELPHTATIAARDEIPLGKDSPWGLNGTSQRQNARQRASKSA